LATQEKLTKVLSGYLIHWKDFPLDDAMQEGLETLQHPTWLLLLGKTIQGGGHVTMFRNNPLLCKTLVIYASYH